MKLRQIAFRQTGGSAYGKAQVVAYGLRSLGHVAEEGCIPSSLGSWADIIYLMTDAPMGIVRKLAARESLEVRR